MLCLLQQLLSAGPVHLLRFCSLLQQASHVDKTGHTSKTSSFNDRRDSRDQPDPAQPADPQSADFELVYNQGLTLQERASQAGGSTQGQLDLLKQASQLTEAKTAACVSLDAYLANCMLLHMLTCSAASQTIVIAAGLRQIP